MTKLNEIVDVDLLAAEVEAGFISARHHPLYDHYVIYNYTPEAQFSRRWNAATRLCRGLIVNMETMDVLARPFAKMHNWDEAEAPAILDWKAPLYAYGNKFDGSLGILYRLPNGEPAIATRGSFASEQAFKGTNILHASGMAYVADEWIDSGYTPLFEIIYPENRIVLNYGDQEFLQPLGYIHVVTGAYLPVPAFSNQNGIGFEEIIQNLSRPNSEGWVVWTSEFKGVKIKQADYVELHRVVTGLNRKSIWRAIKDGKYETMLAQLPDELYKWAEEVATDLWTQFTEKIVRIDQEYIFLGLHLPEDADQKTFALAVQKHIPLEYRGYMFSRRQGKDVNPKVWDSLEPKGNDK